MKIIIKSKESDLTNTLEASGFSSRSERGFTLIELLVVIAIIGILSAVVVAALGNARSSAKEASILSTLHQAQIQAGLYYDGSYSGLCQTDKIEEMLESLEDVSEGADCWVADDPDSSDSYSGSDPQMALLNVDFGIAAKTKDRYYGVSPQGVVTFDDTESGSSNNQDWYESKDICANKGKFLPTASVLRAAYGIGGREALEEVGITTGWTYSASEYSETQVFGVGLHAAGGHVLLLNKSGNAYVLCIE